MNHYQLLAPAAPTARTISSFLLVAPLQPTTSSMRQKLDESEGMWKEKETEGEREKEEEEDANPKPLTVEPPSIADPPASVVFHQPLLLSPAGDVLTMALVLSPDPSASIETKRREVLGRMRDAKERRCLRIGGMHVVGLPSLVAAAAREKRG